MQLISVSDARGEQLDEFSISYIFQTVFLKEIIIYPFQEGSLVLRILPRLCTTSCKPRLCNT